MIHVLYFLVCVCATWIGSLTGMGGGVIIKPVLDALGVHTAQVSGLLSSATVFVMAMISVAKQGGSLEALRPRMSLPLAGGSLLGGAAGQMLLTPVSASMDAGQLLILQNLILACLVATVLFYMKSGTKRPTLHMEGLLPSAVTGTVLGSISSFLGIGGGPLNVALILLVFSCSMKTATLCSLITILFAQASKLLSAFLSGQLTALPLSFIPPMMAGAVIGSQVGSRMSKRLDDRMIESAFGGAQVLVLVICMFNIVRNLR